MVITVKSDMEYILYTLYTQATAVRINLILVLALARVGYQQTVIVKTEPPQPNTDVATARPSNETGFRRYEMCIKEIMICFMLQDAAIDYDDVDYVTSDEDVGDVHVRDKENIVHWRFRKANCVPLNVSSATRKKFWRNVQLWQEEVEKLFLNENMFIHSEEDNGQFKIKLWKIHKMPQNVTCNKTLANPIIPPKEECDEEQSIAIWIRDQIVGGKRVDTLTTKAAKILDELSERFHNEGCHSYADIRNKIDMINDNIDFILGLRGAILPKRSASTGNTRQDLNNLTIRLQYLKENPMGSSECCTNWEQQVERVKERVNALLQVDRSKINTEYDELQQSYTRLQQEYTVQLNRLIEAEQVYKAQVKARRPSCTRCVFLDSKVKFLGKRMQYRDKVIESSMQRKMEYRGKPKLELIDTELVGIENDPLVNFDRNSDDSLENIVEKIEKMNLDADGIIEVYEKLSISANKDKQKSIQDLMEELNRLREEQKRLTSAISDRGLDSSVSYKNSIELNNCFQKLNAQCHTQTEGPMDLSKQETDLSKIDAQITELILELTKLRTESREQAMQLENFKEESNNRIEEKQKLIDLSDAKESIRLKQFKERIDRLEQDIIDANANTEDFSKINAKLLALEKSLYKMRTADNDASLLLTIEQLKHDLAVLNEDIDNINVSAHKCSIKCDWGDLPSYEELLDRLNALKSK